MWKRNLLFFALVASGLVALTAGLYPAAAPPRPLAFDPIATPEAEFDTVVAAVNAAFREQWAEQKLRPAPAAPELAVARRLSLGLAGTVPSVQEIRQLERLPEGRRASGLLAGLLADRRFADYFAERLTRSYVGVEDGPFLVYRRRRFRSWLSDELLRNRPYGELVRDMIAATGVWTDQPASNFLTVTITNEKKYPDPERLAGRVAKTFLGVRLDCAQCHNHPFAPWKQTDFHAIAAFFGHARQGFTGIYDDAKRTYEMENRKTGNKEAIAPRVPFLEELLPARGTLRERLASWVTDPKNHYFAEAAVNRVWALLFGKPLVEPVDDVRAGGEPPKSLRLLAADFATHGHDLKRLIRLIAATEVFHLDSAADHELTEDHEKAWAAFPLTRLRPEQVAGALEQSASLETAAADSPLLARLTRSIQEADFVKRYGDTGEDNFDGRGGTIPQRLLLMNGNIVKELTKEGLFNASTRIGWLAHDDRTAVEVAYLAVLSRRPTDGERALFEARLEGTKPKDRNQAMEDLYWVLLNTTEFSWNH